MNAIMGFDLKGFRRASFLTLLFFSSLVAGEIRLKDYTGEELLLDKPATRVVALSPHIVENVFAAGAGDFLVGVVEHSDFPEQALSLPKVGGFAGLNREVLLALKPDLVIAWKSGNGAEMINQVKELGIPVFIDEPTAMADIAASMRAIGKLTDREQAANHAARKFLTKLAQLEMAHTDLSQISVLYQIWHSPIQTVNKDHLISKIISLCGGYNAFGDAIPVAPVINRETVIARNPDIIIASGIGEERPEWLDFWKQWPSLNAVKNNDLYHIPPDYLQRHTPRVLQGAEMMCEHIDRLR